MAEKKTLVEAIDELYKQNKERTKHTKIESENSKKNLSKMQEIAMANTTHIKESVEVMKKLHESGKKSEEISKENSKTQALERKKEEKQKKNFYESYSKIFGENAAQHFSNKTMPAIKKDFGHVQSMFTEILGPTKEVFDMAFDTFKTVSSVISGIWKHFSGFFKNIRNNMIEKTKLRVSMQSNETLDRIAKKLDIDGSPHIDVSSDTIEDVLNNIFETMKDNNKILTGQLDFEKDKQRALFNKGLTGGTFGDKKKGGIFDSFLKLFGGKKLIGALGVGGLMTIIGAGIVKFLTKGGWMLSIAWLLYEGVKGYFESDATSKIDKVIDGLKSALKGPQSIVAGAMIGLRFGGFKGMIIGALAGAAVWGAIKVGEKIGEYTEKARKAFVESKKPENMSPHSTARERNLLNTYEKIVKSKEKKTFATNNSAIIRSMETEGIIDKKESDRLLKLSKEEQKKEILRIIKERRKSLGRSFGKTGEWGDPRKDENPALSYLRSPNTKMDGLQPNVRHNFESMAMDFREMTGRKLHVNSAYRSFADQQRLINQGYHAAAPGRSMHNYGYAIDVNSADVNRLSSLGLLQKYGFHRPLRSEGWHIEPKGIDRASIRNRAVAGNTITEKNSAVYSAEGESRGAVVAAGKATASAVANIGRNMVPPRASTTTDGGGNVTNIVAGGGKTPTITDIKTTFDESWGITILSNSFLG